MEEERVLVSTSWQQRLGNENYKNWLKVGYALSLACDGTRPYIERETKAFHASLTARPHLILPCTCTHTPRRRPNPYHDMITCEWAKELKNHHNGKPTWNQSYGSLWNDPNVGYWEIAKLYMPFGCATGKVCAAETDATGLLNLLCLCNYFRTDRTLVERLKNTRNTWAHAATQELDTTATTEAFLAMKDFLQDPELATEGDAIDALNEIVTLENDALIDFEDLETKVVYQLKQYITSMKEELAAKIDSMKDQEEINASEIKNEICQLSDILNYCMKVGKERDIVLCNMQSVLCNMQSDLSNMQGQMDILIQSRSDVSSSRKAERTFEVVNVVFRSIALLTITLYLRIPRVIPRKAILMVLLLSSITILDENLEEFGCTRDKSDDPLDLKEIDFTESLNRAREGFVGRQWLFKELEKSHEESKGVMIIGTPGFGKSALISNLICSKLSSSSIHSQILGYHLCIHSYRNTQNSAKFVRNLASMIAWRLQEYEDVVKRDKFLQKILKDECSSDPAGCFEQGVLAPLSRLRLRFLKPTMYIVVDALDECFNENELDKGTSIVNILSHNIKMFPSWLKVIVTSRNVTMIRRMFSSLDVIELHPEDPRNIRDIERFIISKLHTSFLSHIKSLFIGDFSIQALVNKSQGNFLYIKLVVEYLQTKGVTAATWNSLPTSINSVYQEFFKRKYNTDETFRGPRKIFEILVATLSPLTAEELHGVLLTEFTNPEDFDFEYDFLPMLEDLSMYLSNTQENQVVTVFHNSLTEWLTSSSNKGGKFYVDEKKGNRLLANYYFKKIYDKSVNITPQFVYNLGTYIVKGSNLKQHTDSFKNLDPKMIKVADNNTNITALHIAAGEDNDRILALLLNIFKDVDIEDTNGRTPAFFAVRFGRLDNLRLLHKRGASLDHLTKLTGDLKDEDDMQCCERQMCGYSLLHVASQNNYEQIMEYLLNNNVNVSILSGTGGSAVHLAAKYGHFQTIKTLMEHGAVADTRCLHYAALHGSSNVVRFLLKRGVEDTCMECSELSKDHSKVQLLLNLDARHKYRRHCNTALHIAAIKNFPSVAKVLLKSKNNAVRCTNIYGKEPLLEAVQSNHSEVIKLLLEHGANPSSFCKFNLLRNSSRYSCPCGYSALHLAAYYGFTATTKLLLKYKADYNAKDCKGLQPIHVASCCGQAQIVSILVENGADVNCKGPNDMTPLHFACKCQADGVFDKLFDLGANVTAFTADEKTPLHFIIQNRIDEEFFLIDPYVGIPIDPIYVSSKNMIEYPFKQKYPWMISLTKFLVNLANRKSTELKSLFDLSLDTVFIDIITYANVSKSIFGSFLPLSGTFAALTTPLYYAYDIATAYHFQQIPDELSTVARASFRANRRKNTNCYFLIHLVEHNLIYLLDTLIGMGSDVNCGSLETSSPLLVYLRQGGRNMAKVLVKHEVTVDIKCGEVFEDSVFHLAAYHKLHYLQYISVFRDPVKWEQYLKKENALFDYLFDEYDNITVEGQVKVTRVRDGPVTKAIKSHPRGFKIIDECLDNEGYTALHRAAQGGNVVAVKHFLNWGANLTKRTSPEGFENPLVLSIWYAVKYRPYFNFHKPSLSTFLEIEFASLTASAILHHLTKEKPLYIGCDHNKNTPTLLHLAATRGMWRFIDDLFIAKDHFKVTGLTANCPTKDNITPMYLAKLYGGDDCDWDNPWCKVVGTLLKFGASMIYPDPLTEYFLVFNLLFAELPGRLDLHLDKQELKMLQENSKTFKRCSKFKYFLVTDFFDDDYFDKSIDTEHFFKNGIVKLYIDSTGSLLKVEDKFRTIASNFDSFLTIELKEIKSSFSYLKTIDDVTLRCVTPTFQQQPLQITDEHDESKLMFQETNSDINLEIFEKLDFIINVEEIRDHCANIDKGIRFPPHIFSAENLDMCSSETTMTFEILDDHLKNNHLVFKDYYKSLNKDVEKAKRAFQQYFSGLGRSDYLVVKTFKGYQNRLNCPLNEITFKYAQLKFLLHTIKFWKTQVQKISVYPSISKFVSRRIQDVFLNENAKELSRLILQLAAEDPSVNYKYLKMLRFTKPPMFDRTMKSIKG